MTCGSCNQLAGPLPSAAVSAMARLAAGGLAAGLVWHRVGTLDVMRKPLMSAVAVAAMVVVSACGGDDTSPNSGDGSDSGTATASGAGGGAAEGVEVSEESLAAAASSYAQLFLGVGTSGDLYSMLNADCQGRISRAEVDEQVAFLRQHMGVEPAAPAGTYSVSPVTVSGFDGSAGTATWAYLDGSTVLEEEVRRWVHDGDGWKLTGCFWLGVDDGIAETGSVVDTGELTPADHFTAANVDAESHPTDPDATRTVGGFVVTVDEVAHTLSDGVPAVRAVVRVENRSGADTRVPELVVSCVGTDAVGRPTGTSAVVAKRALPASTFAAGETVFVLPDGCTANEVVFAGSHTWPVPD